MTFRVRKPFFILLLLTITMVGTAAYAYYTGYFILKTVTIEPPEYQASLEKIPLRPGQNLLSLPVDESLTFLCDGRRVSRVELKYQLPGAVKIEIKNAVPTVLAFGDDRKALLGIDHSGRVIPYTREESLMSFPLVTGLKNLRLYEKVSDSNFTILLEQLIELRAQGNELYENISTIHLSPADSVVVYIDGLPFPVITYPGRLAKALARLPHFLSLAQKELKEIIYIDLRSQEQIIAKRKECPKQKS
ncbi:MAG: hypothetical protein HRF51_04895 [bacterium]|jgi:cell division septal protein FtsQ